MTSSNFSFGLNTQNQGQLTPSSTSSLSLFGKTSTPSLFSSGGLAQTQTAVTSGTGSFSFGTVAQPGTSTSGFNLGGASTSTNSQTTSGFSFGSTVQPTSVQPSGGLSLGLGASTGISQPLQPSNTGFSIGSTTNIQPQVSQTTSGFNLGTSAPLTVSTTSALNFGLTATTSSGSLFSLPQNQNAAVSSSIATTSVGLGGSVPTTSIGLGGTFTASDLKSSDAADAKNEQNSVKEAPLPQDIFSTLSIFTNHKNAEKKHCEENVRKTAAPFLKLIDDTSKLKQHILTLSNQHNQLRNRAKKLKTLVIEESENVEMARRTQDTPANNQGENVSPEQFFLKLIRSFEDRMTFCRNKIEEVEKCVKNNNGNAVNSEDIKEILKKEHDMVKLLAAKIYNIHNQLLSLVGNKNATSLLDCDSILKPQSVFGDSVVLRPAHADSGSGLVNFQTGQQKAMAISLGPSPPNVALNNSTAFNVLGSTNQSGGLFGTSSSLTGIKPAFGSSLNQSGGLFGQTSGNLNQSGGLFGQTSGNLNQSGGLFGQTSGNLNQSGGLFGQTSGNLNQSGGLFGQTSGNLNQSGGLFGQTSGNLNQSGGIFGNTNTSTLFGSSTNKFMKK